MAIVIKKNGIFHYGDLVENKNIIKELQNSIVIEERLTLKDVFIIVEKYPKLKKFIKKFCSVELIDDYHIEAFRTDKTYHKGELTLQHRYDVMNEKQSFSTLEMYLNNEEGINSVPLSPIREIANLPISANFTSVFSSDKMEKTYKYEFSLLEFLTTIYDEISFHGSDEAKEKLRNSIKL